ncbi:MAG: translocase [Chloroflexales bacterium]|nr:translocase [Chloroflexales bacterium]
MFNIHLFELLLIAGLALVVFGPERLPEIGRFAGKQVARFLAWQQQSPELKMINDVRSEFEQEIASLRDELVRTRRQLDISQDVNLNSIRDELRPLLNLRNQPVIPPAGGRPVPPASATEIAAPPAEPATVAEGEPPRVTAAPAEGSQIGEAQAVADSAPEPPGTPAVEAPEVRPTPMGTVQAAARPNRLAATKPTGALDQSGERAGHPSPAAPSLNGQGRTPTAGPADSPSSDEVRLMRQQIERLSADLQALISGLHERGLLGADWQPSATSEQETLSR